MQLDDEICYCYHVTMRKLVNYSRRVQPQRASQMTGCLNAGTGCGWCIPFLVKIAADPDAFQLNDLTPEDYAQRRSDYRRSGQEKNTFSTSTDIPGSRESDREIPDADAHDEIHGEIHDEKHDEKHDETDTPGDARDGTAGDADRGST